MAKDFAKSASKARHSRAARPATDARPSPLRPFVAGSVFGVLLCLGGQWFLSQNSRTEPGEPLADLLTPDTITGPVLDFYTKLREVEVIVPDESRVRESDHVLYLLQAGSFPDARDADSVRAQLILLNLTAEISEFDDSGKIGYRVIVGPFSEYSTMSKTRTVLIENGIETLLLTRPVKK